ncbi:MAG: hypothetical protein RIQ81_624 [Pseudomonadota bacterium]
MICDRGNTVPGKAATNNRVTFPGDSLVDGDVCALEVRADIPAEALGSFKWLSKPAEQAQGLLYGSNKGRIKDRKLVLTLYKLYAKVGGDTFAALVDVTFRPNESRPGQPAPNTGNSAPALPDPARMTASLQCLSGSYATDVYRQGGAASVGTFQFNIEVGQAMGTSCDRLTVLQDNIAVFEGDLDSNIVNFSAPRRAEVLRFPRNFDLFPVVVEGPGTGDGQAGPGECLNYDGARQTCQDRKSFDLPNSRNYWVAKVEGRDATGARMTYFVTSGAYGFRLDDGSRQKTVADLTASLAVGASTAQKQKYNWYSSAAEGLLFDYDFDEAFTGGAYLASFSVNRESIAGFKAMHVERVWTHGLHEVIEAELEGKFMARWAGLVSLVNGGARVEFVVAGPRDYFHSQSKAAGTTSLPRYFSWEAFKRDRSRTELTGSQADYAAYALVGTPFAPAGCGMTLASLLDQASGMTRSAIDVAGAGAVRNSTFESCRVAKSAFPLTYDNWSVSVRYFLWGWRAII